MHPNVQAIVDVAERLGELRDEVAFLGGATVSLLVSEPGAHKIRATKDVDCVVEVASLAAYHRLDERLRAKGFLNVPGPVICRYEGAGRVLDIMPTEESILGFGNRWAKDAVRTADWFDLREGLAIRLVSPVMLFATKLEAFLARGRRDISVSHDLEDLVMLVDGRPQLAAETREHAPPGLLPYLREVLGDLVADPDFVDALAGHLPSDAASQRRLPQLRSRFETLATLG